MGDAGEAGRRAKRTIIERGGKQGHGNGQSERGKEKAIDESNGVGARQKAIEVKEDEKRATRKAIISEEDR